MIDPEPTTGPPIETGDEELAEEPLTFRRWLLELVVLVVSAFLVAQLLQAFVVKPFRTDGASMEPTLVSGDLLLVNRLVYAFGRAKPGDVVVLAAPNDPRGRDFVKRVVAIEGQTVEERGGQVYVDGKPRSEPYISPVPDGQSFGPVSVPSGYVFVMGDNRSNSQDSRYFGALPRKALLGKAMLIYWPLTLAPGQHRIL